MHKKSSGSTSDSPETYHPISTPDLSESDQDPDSSPPSSLDLSSLSSPSSFSSMGDLETSQSQDSSFYSSLGSLSQGSFSLSQSSQASQRSQRSKSEPTQSQPSQSSQTAFPFSFQPMSTSSNQSKKSSFLSFSANSVAPDGKKRKFDSESHESGTSSERGGQERALKRQKLSESTEKPVLLQELLAKGPENDVVKELFADWCLKKSGKFASTKTFEWCEHDLASKTESRALSAFLRGNGSSVNGKEKEREDSDKLEFEKLMFYYIYPSSPLELSFVETVKLEIAEKLESKDWEEKRKEWCSSFTSIFELLDDSLCPFFYVLFLNFSVLFLSEGTASCKTITALLTTSNLLLRNTFENKGIQFTRPFGIQKQSTVSKEEKKKYMKDIDMLAKLNPSQVSRANEKFDKHVDNSHEGALFIKGPENVRKLFNFLSTYHKENIYLPTICTNQTAFLGATLKRIKTVTEKYAASKDDGLVDPTKQPTLVSSSLNKPNASTTTTTSSLSASLKKSKVVAPPTELFVRYKIKLEGPLFPDTVVKLFQLFKKTHGQYLSVWSEEKGTEELNRLIKSSYEGEKRENGKKGEGEKKDVLREEVVLSEKFVVLMDLVHGGYKMSTQKPK